MSKPQLVVLSGSGMSKDSGLDTFRDVDGLWQQYDVKDVASPIGWAKDPEYLLNFYNMLRKKYHEVGPHEGHKALRELEEKFDVCIITQNVDDLHEQAGSTNIVHLHGELFKSRSTADPSLIYQMEGDELNIGDLCELGSQLRPHIVFFGEDVPEFLRAVHIVRSAEYVIVVGTSLAVYPANTLLQEAHRTAKVYLVDPVKPVETFGKEIEYVLEGAASGIPKVVERLVG